MAGISPEISWDFGLPQPRGSDTPTVTVAIQARTWLCTRDPGFSWERGLDVGTTGQVRVLQGISNVLLLKLWGAAE